ncbi:hypothetical protein [Nonomuraea cavernae]|uniref:hypothetical protein n=1 Tax=Nonomuraea cavernae TaxID=2045107 RepID=UPI0033DA9503
MSDEAAAIAAHAVVLQSDARTLAECVERLREIEAERAREPASCTIPVAGAYLGPLVDLVCDAQ